MSFARKALNFNTHWIVVGSDSTRYYGKGVYLEITECKQLRAVNVEDTFPAPAQKNKEMEPILKQQASNTALELI